MNLSKSLVSVQAKIIFYSTMAEHTKKYPFLSNLNVANFITIKLNDNNYLLWETQVLSLIESQDLLGFLNGETTAPEVQVASDDGKNISVYEGERIENILLLPLDAISDVLSAAANTGIYAIPLAWTLAGDKETFQGDVVPRIDAVIQVSNSSDQYSLLEIVNTSMIGRNSKSIVGTGCCNG